MPTASSQFNPIELETMFPENPSTQGVPAEQLQR